MQSCQPGTERPEHTLTILTTIPPLYSFTKNVAGDLAHVENLLPRGAEPHAFAFGPADIKKVSKAQIVIINGLGLETWMDKLLMSAGDNGIGRGQELFIVDTSSGIDPINGDPHIWLSPARAVAQVKNIRDALSRFDRANAETYSRNASSYISRLQSLHNEIAAAIESLSNRDFVSFHPAFTYFASDYGLNQAAVVKDSPDIESSPSRIASVIKTIKEKNIKAIFSEAGSSHKILTSIANDLSLDVYELDPLEQGSLSPGWYEERMRENLRVLKEALSH